MNNVTAQQSSSGSRTIVREEGVSLGLGLTNECNLACAFCYRDPTRTDRLSLDQVKAVMELASFDRFSATHETFLDQLTESIGIVINTIEANMRTEDLLKQSQSLARELQSQQEELQQTNAELEDTNRGVVALYAELDQKAEDLRTASEMKSRFCSRVEKPLFKVAPSTVVPTYKS